MWFDWEFRWFFCVVLDVRVVEWELIWHEPEHSSDVHRETSLWSVLLDCLRTAFDISVFADPNKTRFHPLQNERDVCQQDGNVSPDQLNHCTGGSRYVDRRINGRWISTEWLSPCKSCRLFEKFLRGTAALAEMDWWTSVVTPFEHRADERERRDTDVCVSNLDWSIQGSCRWSETLNWLDLRSLPWSLRSTSECLVWFSIHYQDEQSSSLNLPNGCEWLARSDTHSKGTNGWSDSHAPWVTSPNKDHHTRWPMSSVSHRTVTERWSWHRLWASIWSWDVDSSERCNAAPCNLKQTIEWGTSWDSDAEDARAK